MTEQRPRLMIRQCGLEPSGQVKLEYLLKDFSPDSTTFYCSNAFHNESGICCRERGSERCPVYVDMIEQLAFNVLNRRNKSNQAYLSAQIQKQGPRLAGPLNHPLRQGYLNSQQD